MTTTETSHSTIFFQQSTVKNISSNGTTSKKKVQNAPIHAENNENIRKLGVISKTKPTISHLLAKNSQYRTKMWQILDLPVNRNKSFTKVPLGATVSINLKTKEISWGDVQKIREQHQVNTKKTFATELLQIKNTKKSGKPDVINMTHTKEPQKPKDLSEAVQQYIGTPYNKLNCYNLVVHGLKNLGIPYGGQEGLQHKLIDMAIQKGLPSNAYLTGEGLTKATGSRLLFESYLKIDNPSYEAKKVLTKMSAILQKGQILSFSTPTKGHTGIISQQENGSWTFINSGRMDNSIEPAKNKQEVGEEHLLAELTNWFSLANKRKESLTVTLGQLRPHRIASINKEQQVSSHEIKYKPLLVSI